MNVAARMRESAQHKCHRKGFTFVLLQSGERAVMLGVAFRNGPGAPAVLALSRPVGLKVPSPHRLSTSNSWRSLSTAKVGVNAWTSGTSPIFTHISQLSNLWGDIQIHDWPFTSLPSVESNVKQLKLLKYDLAPLKVKRKSLQKCFLQLPLYYPV